jgi:hypothetical protein
MVWRMNYLEYCQLVYAFLLAFSSLMLVLLYF